MALRSVLTVQDLPEAMCDPQFCHGRFRPVVQFIMDWNDQPQRRVEMLCGGAAPPGGTPGDLALLAAVVHGLCERDGSGVPEWVWSQRLDSPVTMSGRPTDSDWGRWVVSQAPPVCKVHGVFFEADLLAAR